MVILRLDRAGGRLGQHTASSDAAKGACRGSQTADDGKAHVGAGKRGTPWGTAAQAQVLCILQVR